MCQVGAVQIADSEFAEYIVKDRRRILDTVVALHHARWFELGEGKGIHKLLKRHAVLKTNTYSDGKVVHHRPETCTFLVHVDEYLTQISVFVFTRAQINLVPAHDRLLRVTLAALWHLFTV